MDTFRYQYGETQPVLVPVASETFIEIGDLVWMSDGQALPASALEDQGDEAANQALLAQHFAGVAMQRSRPGDAAPIRVATGGVFEFASPAMDISPGAALGGMAATPDGLRNQFLRPVLRPELAVAVANQATFQSPRVLVRIVSRWFGSGLHLASRYTSQQRLLNGAVTLSCDDAYRQEMDPNGDDRDIIMPAEGPSRGLSFLLINLSTSDDDLLVRASDTTTLLATLNPGEATRLECDGAAWQPLVLAAA